MPLLVIQAINLHRANRMQLKTKALIFVLALAVSNTVLTQSDSAQNTATVAPIINYLLLIGILA